MVSRRSGHSGPSGIRSSAPPVPAEAGALQLAHVLRAATQSSVKHRRLKYLLLFALRCAFIALLVLAFARPYIHSTTVARANGGRTMVFAIDNSFSMRQDDRFTRAKDLARAEIAKMHDADRGQVITFGGPAKLLTDMTPDQQSLLARLGRLEPGDDTSSYAEISRILRSTVGKPQVRYRSARFHRRSEIFPARRFSDLQTRRRHKARRAFRGR